MARPSYGPQAQKQASRLLEALLIYASDDLENLDRFKIEFNWQSKNQLIIKTTIRYLELLVARTFKDYKLTSEQIKESLKRYQDFLEILEDHRTKTQGSDDWHFTLNLWFGRQEKAANLNRFHEEWEYRRAKKTGQNSDINHKLEPDITQSREILEVDDLVRSIREKVSANIQARCGTMRVLDMAQPIELNTVYTTVNIYESISAHQRRGLTDILQQFSVEDFSHLHQIQKTRISGLMAVERYSKLMIFGKPGAGKTVFLKWLAIQCNSNQQWSDLIPVFVTMKAFAEAKGQPELLTYIHKQWAECKITPTQIETLFKQGRVLILLDGLDEVREVDHDRVLQEIQEFSTQFHTCLFVITCRIAAREYIFEQFTEVEIADFDIQQMIDFATRWFEARNNPEKVSRFLKNLHDHQRIRDLATSPLLLTLLCLVFEASDDFYSNRAELYREGLEVLLRKWDAKRNIERDGLHQRSELYRRLSLQCKEALLSQVAFKTFERGDYFFKQRVMEQYIEEFLRTLPILHHESDPVEIDGEAVLKAIEAQHGLLVERARGVYSFSHLTFHEYFTAKKIAGNSDTQLNVALQALVTHIIEKEWQEVFFLTAGMLKSADALLLKMKAQIDQLISSDTELQKFLTWLNERAISAINHPTNVDVYYKPAIVKAYHSFLIFDHISIRNSAVSIASAVNRTSMIDKRASDTTFARDNEEAIASVIANAGDNERAIAISLVIAGTISSALETSVERTSAVTIAIDKAIALTLEPNLKSSLQNLKTQLPDPKRGLSSLKQWWKDYGYTWTSQLRDVQIKYRNLIYDYSFSNSQIALLEQYYRANLLLVDCLNSDCCVSQAVRDEIETTLLMSIEDIKQYKQNEAKLDGVAVESFVF